MKSFKRGVFIKDFKQTSNSPIEKAELSSELILYLRQHIGASLKPIVVVGDKVLKFQKIADGEGDGLFVPIHAPSSGEVIAIEKRPSPGKDELAIIIKTDGKDKEVSLVTKDPLELSFDEVVDKLREAGVVGMGGAMFPTYAKLKNADFLIINGSECEPYLSSDHRLMLEEGEKIIRGASLILNAIKGKKVFFAIESNKADAISKIKSIATSDFSVVEVKTKYPQGAEKMLVYAVLGKKISGLPISEGIVVMNVATVKAAFDALFLSKPLVERVVTVSGLVTKPKNFLVPLGTPIKDLINQCDGFHKKPDVVVAGGPMMGIALNSLDVGVIKGMNGVTSLMENIYDESVCMRCGKCVNICPMNLVPSFFGKLAKKNLFSLAKNYNVKSCIECGSCSFVCPSRIPLVQYIKTIKRGLK